MVRAIQGAAIIDGTGRAPVADGLLLIEKGQITYAGPMREIPKGAEVIDGAGLYAMPGIIDTHLHFSGNLTGDDSDWVMEPLLQKAVVAVQQAHECLEAGLTTVGEISRFGIHIRNMVEQGVMSGPRIVASGLGFCATAGHGDSHRVPSELNRDSHPWAECADGPWELRRAVRRRIRENPDAIKIWATGGGMWRWETASDQHYTFEELQACAEECRMRGIPLWSHCFGDVAPSVEAGADMIIHGWQLNDETAQRMAERGIFHCPTINFLPAWFAQYPPKYEPALHDPYPGETVWEKEVARIYDVLKRAIRAGVTMVIGSDCFNSAMTPYGDVAIGEIHDFVDKLGMTPLQAIRAATLDGARSLRVEEITGSLETGKSADLLLLDRNPAEDIHAISRERIKLIMKEGRICG